jgi:hypothetical protein
MKVCEKGTNRNAFPSAYGLAIKGSIDVVTWTKAACLAKIGPYSLCEQQLPGLCEHCCTFVVCDLGARTVTKHNASVRLTATEYSLLALFIRNAGKVLTHSYILHQVWGPSFTEETQYLRVFIGPLRKKLEDDPTKPSLLLTESGVGYRLAGEC